MAPLMTRRPYLALATGILFLALCAQGALAYGTEKKLTANYSVDLLIPAGDYKAFIVHLAPGDKMKLTVRVGLGEEIDVYTMSKKDYDDYKAGAQLVSYYSQFSKESLKYFEYSNAFEPAQEGDYVIVIDNLPKTTTGAPGATDVSCTVKVDLQFQAPFPWLMVIGVVLIIVVVAVVVLALVWMRKKKADIEEQEAQKKRAEAAKIRPIFINPQGPAAPGAPPAAGTPSLQAPPPSSSCKSCPHVYDPTSANCIACEYR
jgi:hypothetical protein